MASNRSHPTGERGDGVGLTPPNRAEPATTSITGFSGLLREHAGLLAFGAVVMGSLVPVFRTLGSVHGSSHVQYADYWQIIDGLLATDGSLRWAGFLEFRNEHPVFLPRIGYWLNVELFGGDNWTLGYLVMGVALVQVAVLAGLARGTEGLGRRARVSVLVAATALILSPQGLWSFVRAMSGAAWLTANLLVVGAFLAFQRDRRFLAPVLAALATWSYGTGLAAWPALLAAGLVRDGRAWRRNWPTFAGMVVLYTWYLLWFRSSESSTSAPGPIEFVRQVVERLGWPIAGAGPAFALGAVCLVVFVGAAWTVWRRSGGSVAAPWIGLGVYGMVSSVLITNSRGDWMDMVGHAVSRYVSLGSATWIAAIALAIAALPQRWWTWLVPAPLVLVVWFAPAPGLHEMQAKREQDLLGIAMVIDVADGSRVTTPFVPFPTITERLERSGHHPFDDRLSIACDDLGLGVEVVDRLPAGLSGRVEVSAALAPGAVSMEGEVDLDGAALECVVVIDPDDRVVGAGTTWEEGDGVLGFETLAPEAADLRVAVRLAGEDAYRLLPPPSAR